MSIKRWQIRNPAAFFLTKDKQTVCTFLPFRTLSPPNIITMDSTTDNDKVQRRAKVRQGQWLALAAFTSVTLVAMRSRFENNLSDEKQPVKWAMSSASVVLFASTLSCVYHFLMPKKFVGTLWEGGMVRV
jgi:hypothetical protein